MNNSRASAQRPYRMTARAQQAAETAQRILDATKAHFETSDFDQVTLAGIARDAAVTEQTVIRRFSNKEGLLAALIEREMPRVEADRIPVDGDHSSLEQAIQTLVRHYEEDGYAILNYLRQEERSEAVKSLLGNGRALHARWVALYCRDVLGDVTTPEGERRLSAVIAATDIYTWKVLRLDRGQSVTDVEQIILSLIRGLQPKPEVA